MYRTIFRSPIKTLALLGVLAGVFVLDSLARQRRRKPASEPVPEALPTRALPPTPATELLASVAGEEDPGAAVDAPAVSPPAFGARRAH